MNKRHVLLTAVLSVGGVGLVASPAWAEDQRKPESSQGQTDASAGTSTADQPHAGQSSSDLPGSAQTAGAKQGSASQSDARQILSETVNAALTKGQFQSLNRHLSQADQQRLGDLSQQGQQLDQSIDQLKQAYQEKFQQDLDLSQNVEQTFTAQFFQVGGGLGDQAAAASGTQPPDSSSVSDAGAAGTGASSDAASAGATASDTGTTASGTVSADAAQTAGSTSGAQKTTITIPPSHGGSEAVKVNLVQEGGQWKIDLPDSTDGKQLAHNLQQHIDMVVQQKDQWADAAKAQQEIARHVLMAFAETSASGAGADGASGAGRSDSPSGVDASGKTSDTESPER